MAFQKGFTHTKDEINSENYFSSKLKTDGNIVFDPLRDCCANLHRIPVDPCKRIQIQIVEKFEFKFDAKSIIYYFLQRRST